MTYASLSFNIPVQHGNGMGSHYPAALKVALSLFCLLKDANIVQDVERRNFISTDCSHNVGGIANAADQRTNSRLR